MRLHISVADDLVAELDRRVGVRGRSSFLSQLIRQALDDAQRWDEIEAALGGIADSGHEWDDDPSAWVRGQRRADARRTG